MLSRSPVICSPTCPRETERQPQRGPNSQVLHWPRFFIFLPTPTLKSQNNVAFLLEFRFLEQFRRDTASSHAPSCTAPALASPWNFYDVPVLFILCEKSRALGADGAPSAPVIIAAAVALINVLRAALGTVARAFVLTKSLSFLLWK